MKWVTALVTALVTASTITAPVAADSHVQSEWDDVTRLLSAITDAYTNPPALNNVRTNGYTAGLILGNGDLAVTSDARDHAQNYYLAKSDFWHASNGQLPVGTISISSPRDQVATATAKDTLECTAACAIDGDPETRWVSSTNASTADPQWLAVDLGQAKTINRWVVRHNGYAGRADNFQKLNTKDFALQRSSDGTTWTTVDSVTGNTNELTDRTVPAFSARYLRLNVTGAVRVPDDPNQKVYIRDLQLFNTTDTDPNYHQQQDILNAEVRGTVTMGGEAVHTRTWPADGENLLVTELWTDTQRTPVQIDLTVPAGTTGVAGSGQVWLTRTTGSDTDTGFVSKAAVSTKVLGSPNPVTASTPSSGNARLAFELAPGTPVRIVTSVRGNGSYRNPVPLASFVTQANDRTAQVNAADVDAARAAHRDWWREFWLKSYVDTGDPVLNKFYYGGLYAVAAGNRAGFFPGGTYSPWRTIDGVNLGNRYFMNYNTEAQYYGVYGANRPELAKPYYPLIQSMLPYVRNSTHAAGYQGLTFRRSFGPYDMTRPAPATTPVAPTKKPGSLPSDQQTNGTFAAIPLLWDYEYTGDVEFFRTVTYPLLKELGAFWTDFVVKENGKYVVRNSAVNEGGNDVNSVYDLGYIRRTLTALIDGSKTLGVDAELRPVWQEVLDNLTPYPTATMDGLDVILLASQITNPIKGNALLNKNDQPINLEGVVHPSDNLAIGGDPELLRKVRNTLQWVDPFKPGTRGSSINGFPKTFTIAARAGWDPEDLIGKFKTVVNNLWRANLTVRQSGGAQETSGSVETVNSMMLQTYQGVQRVFPSWPKSRDAKFVRLRAKGAFLVSSQQRGGTVQYVNVVSEKGNQFTMANPWSGAPIRVFDSAGRFVRTSLANGQISFATTPGRTYYITARGVS